MQETKGHNVLKEYKSENMHDRKRAELEQKLECCEHLRQTFVELHQSEYMRANRLESRVEELEKMIARKK